MNFVVDYPSQQRLKELFAYDSEKGELIWRKDASSRVKAGQTAGTYLAPNGYYQIKIDGRTYWKHRIIYLWHHNQVPEVVDHINRNTTDNRIENLRASCARSNQLNVGARSTKKSGLPKGVYLSSRGKKYYASIMIDRRNRRLGTFETVEEAEAAYLAAEKERLDNLRQDPGDGGASRSDPGNRDTAAVDDAISSVESVLSKIRTMTSLACAKTGEIKGCVEILENSLDCAEFKDVLDKIVLNAVAIEEMINGI